MGAIYGNSVLTIAAADAVDSDAGFLHNREFEMLSFTRPVVLQYMPSDDSPSATLTLRHRELRPPSKPTLSTRGWVVQERLFSRRILYFGKDQMYWECNSCSRFEKSHVPLPNGTFTGDIAPKRSFSDSLSIDLCHSWWRQIVTMYSGCELTYASDRLPAISGIASIIAQITGDKYIAGMWEDDLPRSLLWMHEYQRPYSNKFPRDEHAEYLAPSWSWVSNRNIFYSSFLDGLHETDSTTIRIVQIDMRYAGNDLYGRLRSAMIRVRGKVKIGFVRRFNFSMLTSVHQTFPPYENTNLVAEYHVDDEEFERRAGQAGGWRGDWHLCLYVGNYSEISKYIPLSTNQYALILEPLFTGSHQYRRVGLVKSIGDSAKKFYTDEDPSVRFQELQN
jgi:hypothetical protein